ncbi:peptidase [Merismopedia glauca]|uniref:Peptidase n=1 Tax=Merismopedia glauca CCAP 1448/3 TaxID=1296344 RepID=A0A2T1C2N0_9CYAN|nr:peptidase [Merismopedia glauca]PSB02535.1 peptidase [Merismopedia glauca CCAP 1448/3]
MGYIKRLWLVKKRLILSIGIASFTALLIITLQLNFLQPSWGATSDLPPLQPHPLPATLANWVDNTNSGDYFTQIRPSPAGYLMWFDFPIKVYVEHPSQNLGVGTQTKAEVQKTNPQPVTPVNPIDPKLLKFQEWVDNVAQGIQPWKVYLPLEIVPEAENADIKVLRVRPLLQLTPNGPRARSAEVRYQVYLRKSPNSSTPVLYPKYDISISPDLSANYIRAAALHEIGHALGIWGHSPKETDALYFTQVRNPPPISPRDINTLKLIYQQPTRLGWSIPVVGAKGSTN